MAWLYLLLGSFCEIGWVVLLRNNPFAKPFPAMAAFLLMIGGPVLFNFALKAIPVGTAYVAFVGINTVAVLCASMVLFGERLNLAQILCIALVIGGVIGLRLLQNAAPA